MSPAPKTLTTKKSGDIPRKKSSPAKRKTPPKVFISYSHRDSGFKDELMGMLAILEKQKVIKVWQDREIEDGADWYRAIQSAMRTCKMAILMVSQYFLNSDFIQREELPMLLKQRRQQGLRVVPVIVRHCLWKKDPVLSKIQALPREGRPVITFPRANGSRDKVWMEIAESIGRRARALQRSK